MGSKKSSSQANTSTSTSNVTLQDTDGINVLNSSGTTITDGGAIESNRDVALSAIERAAELTLGLVTAQAKANESALGFASAAQEQANKFAFGAQEQANKFAFDAGRPEASTLKDSGKILLWVGGLIAGAMLLKELKLQ